DHRGRETLDQTSPLLPQGQHVLPGLAQMLPRRMVEIAGAQLPRLLRASFRRGNGNDVGDRIGGGNQIDLVRRETAIPDADVSESAAEAVGRASAGADPQRLFRVERLIEIVEVDLQRLGPAVDVEVDAGGDA